MLRSCGGGCVPGEGEEGKQNEAAAMDCPKAHDWDMSRDYGVLGLCLYWEILRSSNQEDSGVCYRETSWQ